MNKILFVFFLFINHQLLCQTFNELTPVIFPDYYIFEPNPELDFYHYFLPDHSDEFSDIPKSSPDLASLKINLLTANSKFLIDTIYFRNYLQQMEKFKQYRRIFDYNEESRIVSVIGEELLNGQWTKHQETLIIYDYKDRVSEINYLRENYPFNKLKIKYKYDSLNYLREAICKNKTEGEWKLSSINNYFFMDGYLSYSDFFDYEDSTNYCLEFQVIDKNYIIEFDYSSSDSFYIKRTYKLNSDNKIISYNAFPMKESGLDNIFSQDYTFNEHKKISTIEYCYEYSKFILKYSYENNNKIAFFMYRKSFENNTDDLLFRESTFKYNPQHYLVRSKTRIRNNDKVVNKNKTTYNRDESNNIIGIQNEIWRDNEWLNESETRIIYKKKI